MILRPYQFDAIDAINKALQERADNPLAVMPTGSGKTIVFATMIRDWLLSWPETRVGILAHRAELLDQSEQKILNVWPDAPTGIWSSSLRRREGNKNIIIGGINSIYKKAFDIDPFDILIIDECHRIPVDGEGMYRRFLKDCKLANPNVRMIGFTATPWRLDGGHIAAPGHLLNYVCYDADVASLVNGGYLCTLRSKATDTILKADGVSVRKGDYAQDELEKAVNTNDLVREAVSELIAKALNRKSWLVFCSGVSHAHNVSAEIATYGIIAPVITGETPFSERQQILKGFDAGIVRGVVNVNCLTEGLDITRIDCIAMMRPTKSVSLYCQMVGRGFRNHPGKENCLILDFGGNVSRHGPVDAIKLKEKIKGEGEAPSKKCPGCEEIVAAGCRICPCCGHEFPAPKLKHGRTATETPVLRTVEPWDMQVVEVVAGVHRKQGSSDSMKVTYKNGIESHREWVCFEHLGYARKKAEQWWKRRFTSPPPATVAEAMQDMFLSYKLREMTKIITVKQTGKYTEIIGTSLRKEDANAISH